MPPRWAKLQARRFRDLHVGPHPDRTDHELGGQDAAVGQRHGVGLDRRDRGTGDHVHAVRDELVGDEDRELRVDRRQHLRRRFDHRHVDALADEVLGHLEPDEAGADHDRGRGLHVDVDGDARGVLDGAQRAHAVVTRKRRPHGRRARAQHELVVFDDGLRAGARRTGGDGVRVTVDRDDFLVHAGVEPEPVEELLGRLEREVVLVLDQPADEVGEPAVREGHVARALEDRDLRVVVEPPQPRRRRHPARDAADDHHPQAVLRHGRHRRACGERGPGRAPVIVQPWPTRSAGTTSPPRRRRRSSSVRRPSSSSPRSRCETWSGARAARYADPSCCGSSGASCSPSARRCT